MAYEMHVSTDYGLTWHPATGNIRVNYIEADEDVDGLYDLNIILTSEGMILDVVSQQTGKADRTAALDIDSLLDLTS